MTKLETLHRQILKERRRIEMLKNTKELDFYFIRSEIKEAQNKIVELQKEFHNQYAIEIEMLKNTKELDDVDLEAIN